MSVKQLLEEHLELLDKITLDIIDLEAIARIRNLRECEERLLRYLYELKSLSKEDRDLGSYIEEAAKALKVSSNAKSFNDECLYVYDGHRTRLDADFSMLRELTLEVMLGGSKYDS